MSWDPNRELRDILTEQMDNAGSVEEWTEADNELKDHVAEQTGYQLPKRDSSDEGSQALGEGEWSPYAR